MLLNELNKIKESIGSTDFLKKEDLSSPHLVYLGTELLLLMRWQHPEPSKSEDVNWYLSIPTDQAVRVSVRAIDTNYYNGGVFLETRLKLEPVESHPSFANDFSVSDVTYGIVWLLKRL